MIGKKKEKKKEKKKPTVFVIRRRLHAIRRLFFLTLALMIAVASYFHFIGFPPWVIRNIERSLAERNIYVSIENVKLDFYYGLEAQRVHFYQTILRRKPLLTANSIAGYFSVRELLGHHRLIARIHLSKARVESSVLPPEARSFFDTPVVNVLDGEWSPGKLIVQNSDVLWGKLRIHAAGDLLYDKDAVRWKKKSGTKGSLEKFLMASKWVKDTINLRDTAELDLQVSLNTILPERSSLTAKLDGGRLLIRDVFFSDLNCSLSLTPELFSLHSFELKNGSDYLRASGAVGLKDYRTALKINNTLDVKDLALVHSLNLMKWLTHENVDLKDGFQLTLKTGEKDWLKREEVSGTFFAKSLSVRGVPVQNVYSSFKHADGVVEVDRFRAHVPAGTVKSETGSRLVKGGDFTAEGRFDRSTKEYNSSAVVGFDPWLVLPLVTNTPIEYVVRNDECYGDVEIVFSNKGILGVKGSHSIVGRADVGACSRRGAKVDAVQCEFSYLDSLLTLPSIHIQKGDAVSDAMVLINFRTRIIDLELEGGVDPSILATFVHPVVAKPLAQFRFNGENDLRCHGSVDYGKWEKTQLSGSYRGTAIRSPVAEIENASADFNMTGSQLTVTNINAQVYGGTCTGEGSFVVQGVDAKPYWVKMDAQNVGMTELAHFYGASEVKKNLGKLNGHVSLNGDVGKPIRQNVQGTGSARIDDGWLVELPILKTFTQVSRLVFSKFSSFSQTDFSMDFDVHDGAVYSDNLALSGDLMTLNGAGSYDFIRGFDVDVEMKPFRKNMLTRVVQWASTPLSELLKFHVQGTLSNPTWRLARFPDVTSLFKHTDEPSATEK